MHTLLLFAPFDVNFEFDIREFLKGGDTSDQTISSAMGCLQEKLSANVKDVAWKVPKQISGGENQSATYGADHDTYRAPSRRPVWFCRAVLKPENPTF